MIDETIKNPHRFANETGLRFVLVPERVDEMIDPVELESKDLHRRLLEIGHAAGVELFSYEYPKRIEMGVNNLVVVQSAEGYRRGGSEEVRLELTTRGMIVVDMNVTGRPQEPERDDMVSSLVLLEGDIALVLRRSFVFAGAFHRQRDPYRRFERMHCNASLSGIGMRTLMAAPPQGRSYPIGNHGDGAVVAFDKAHLITRSDVERPDQEIDAMLALFRRRLR